MSHILHQAKPFVSREYTSREVAGKALGMHAWGAERPIDPEAASLKIWGKDQFNLDLSVGGPVMEEGFEGRHGYHAGVYLRGLPAEALPGNGGLKEGMHLEKNGQSLDYRDGVLTLIKEETVFEPRFLGLGFKEAEKNTTTIAIETDPTFSRIGDVHYRTESRDKTFFGGYEAPELVTDLRIDEFQLAP